MLPTTVETEVKVVEERRDEQDGTLRSGAPLCVFHL